MRTRCAAFSRLWSPAWCRRLRRELRLGRRRCRRALCELFRSWGFQECDTSIPPGMRWRGSSVLMQGSHYHPVCKCGSTIDWSAGCFVST